MKRIITITALLCVAACSPREEFCQPDYVCVGAECPEQEGCMGFEEAAQLALQSSSGVHTLTTRTVPANTGALIPTASNTDAISRAPTIILRNLKAPVPTCVANYR